MFDTLYQALSHVDGMVGTRSMLSTSRLLMQNFVWFLYNVFIS